MKHIYKAAPKLISLIIVICLAAAPFSVWAAENTTRTASVEYLQVLNLLENLYLNDSELDYKELTDAAIAAVFEQLDDYTQYMSAEDYMEYYGIGQVNKSGIGVSVRINGVGDLTILDVFEGSPAQKAGFMAGDILIKVDGKSLTGMDLEESRDLIVGDTGSTAVMVVIRNGQEKSLTVTRGSYVVPTVMVKDISTLLKGGDDSKVKYLALSSFISVPSKIENDTGYQFKKAYEELKKSGVKNLIIDLRDNTGGDMEALLEISQILVNEGIICTTIDSQGQKEVFRSNKKGQDFNLAVLVNKETASSAEILASAIKESKAGTIVGCTTFGKGVGQIVMPTADGSHYMKITAFEVLSRTGGKIDGVGVTPDISVAPAPVVYVAEVIDPKSSTEDILAFRKALNYIGYPVNPAAVVYDRELADITKQFQKSVNILESGIGTIETIQALNRSVADKYLASDEALNAAYNFLVR